MTERSPWNALNELEIVQNPALGAYSLWHFGLGFQTAGGEAPALPLAFLVLPLLLHRPTMDKITSTRRGSGLSIFASKVGEEMENLLAVHQRALVLRKLTLESLSFATTARLITVNYENATIRSNSLDSKMKAPPIPERIKHIPKAAEKVGHWFSEAGIARVSATLRVDF